MHDTATMVNGFDISAQATPTTSPYTSSWNWPAAALPTRTGLEPS